MSIAQKVHASLRKALEKVGVVDGDFTLEHPVELSHGDFASSVALAYAKRAGKNPKQFADEIAAELTKLSIPEIESVTVAGPGFINIKLSQAFFTDFNAQINDKGAQFGTSQVYAGKKVLVEHSSPNLFKPFHIGHMMNNAIGESLVRIMRASGATVVTMSFPSDISLGVAKAVFIILEKYGRDFLPSQIAVLGDVYVEGTKRYEDDESIHPRVKEIADNLYAANPSPELDVFNVCKRFNISYFEGVVAKLGSHFDSYIYESEAGIVGKEIVIKNTPEVFTESEGAIVYIPDESEKSLNTAVFINSQGNPTYEAKDIGLLDLKFRRIKPDVSLFVTDHEQIPHFKIVLDAAKKIEPEWVTHSIHIPHGRMSFKGQKMSSRLGGVPLVTDMIKLVSEEAQLRAKESAQSEDTEAIAIGALKFSILRAKPGQNINFDPDTSLSFEGDSGPYLQYTHARISTLLKKGENLVMNTHYDSTQGVTDLERVMVQYATVVENAIREHAPQYIVTYLLELARAFNSFYGANKIVDAEQKQQSEHRLAVARATQIILKNGLELLAIKTPERM